MYALLHGRDCTKEMNTSQFFEWRFTATKTCGSGASTLAYLV